MNYSPFIFSKKFSFADLGTEVVAGIACVTVKSLILQVSKRFQFVDIDMGCVVQSAGYEFKFWI